MGPWVCSSQLRKEEEVLMGASGNRYNVSARDLKDHVAVLNIDEEGEDGFFGVHELEVTGNYKSSSGGKDMDFVGIEIEDLGNGRLRFFLVNYRPPVDGQGNVLDAKKIGKVGANATIETFELARGSTKLEHVKTVLSDAVFMPNNIAATGDGGFVVSNCRDSKVEGFVRAPPAYLQPLIDYSSDPFLSSSAVAT